MSQQSNKDKVEQRRREAAERIKAKRDKLKQQEQAISDTPEKRIITDAVNRLTDDEVAEINRSIEEPVNEDWQSPDSPVQEEPDAPVDETVIGPQGPVLEEPQPATTISVNPETDDLPPPIYQDLAKQLGSLDRKGNNEPRLVGASPLLAEPFTPPVDPVAAFKDWLRTPAGLDASDPRMPENDRARFACELDNRLRMAWLAGVASVEGRVS